MHVEIFRVLDSKVHHGSCAMLILSNKLGWVALCIVVACSFSAEGVYSDQPAHYRDQTPLSNVGASDRSSFPRTARVQPFPMSTIGQRTVLQTQRSGGLEDVSPSLQRRSDARSEINRRGRPPQPPIVLDNCASCCPIAQFFLPSYYQPNQYHSPVSPIGSRPFAPVDLSHRNED
jgi:hypothetical protein